METSELLKYRAKHIVPERTNRIQQAIIEKDYKTFAELTMKDSNQMHAAVLDTYPPCTYMNDVSHAVVELIHSYNEAVNSVKVAYTYDAGPNTTLYLLEKDVPAVLGVLDHFFPPLKDNLVEYRRGLPIETVKPSQNLLSKMNIQQQSPGQFKYMIYTKVGDGPKYLKDSKDHLLNSQGLPINHV